MHRSTLYNSKVTINVYSDILWNHEIALNVSNATCDR